MIRTEPIVFDSGQFYIAYNEEKSLYAFGESVEEALEKMSKCPRSPNPGSPKLTRAVCELIRAGKISDELRFQMLDYEAYIILEVL